MKPKALRKLLSLLAASDLSESELYDALRLFREAGPHEITQLVTELRHRLNSITDEMLQYSYLSESIVTPESRVIEDVVRLLLREARLPAHEAATRLRSSISPSGLDYVPEFRPKMGFKNWLEQLSTMLPSSELLHYATRVRNEAVHQPNDWPLRNKEK